MAVMIDLRGTSQVSFQVGKGGPRIVNNAGDFRFTGSDGLTLTNIEADELLIGQINSSLGLPFDAASGSIDFTSSDEAVRVLSRGGVVAPQVRFYDADGSNYIALKSPTGLSSDFVYTLPITPVNGYVLQTDGSGNLSWVAPATAPTGTDTRDTTSIAFNTSSPLAMFTLPANAVVESVQVIVDTAFDGAPTLEVGIAGDTNKYMSQGDVDLTSGAGDRWEASPNEIPVGGTEAIIATYTAGGATVGAGRILVSYSVPN